MVAGQDNWPYEFSLVIPCFSWTVKYIKKEAHMLLFAQSEVFLRTNYQLFLMCYAYVQIEDLFIK